MPILLSDEELEALEGLPHLHRCLYIFGIRRYMDYQTGITGIKRKISYNSLAQDIYVEIRRGVKEDSTKSRDQIKRMLTLLEKSGLIKRKSIITKDEKQLILECILAQRDKSVQNKAAPWPPHSPTLQAALEDASKENEEKPYKNRVYSNGANTTTEDKSRPASRHTENEKAAQYPISDTLHNITLHSTDNFFPVDNSKVDAQAFLNLLAKQGYYINQLHSNKKTLAMVHAWVQAEVSLEEAQIGINHVNQQLGKPPDTPTYYNKPVLQVRNDFKNAQQLAQEITDATNRPRPVTQSKADSRRNRYKKILR